LVRGTEAAWRMRRHPVDKAAQLGELQEIRRTFGRSLFTNRELAQGTLLTEDMLAYKKPGGGIAYEERDSLVGRTTVRPLPADHMLSADDVG
jgi:N-acetylneuraminate synthase